MWDEQKRLLNSQLSPGERLLWSGQPRQGLFFRASDTLAIPFSLLWGGFALFWNFGVWSSGAPIFFRLWGVPFLVMGAYLVFGRFFVDAWMRSKTYYAVTNERVIILSGIFTRDVKSLNLRTLSDISLTERQDLSGTITFGPTGEGSGWGSNFPFSTRRNEPIYPALDSIPNAKRVYEIIREAQRTAA